MGKRRRKRIKKMQEILMVEENKGEKEDEDEMLEGTEVKYNLKIRMKKEVDDKIRWLTSNCPEEISAFLTGDIKDGVITIDGLLFPYQDVSSASVEVEPKNLVKLRKEYGNECLRIVGHWHSHNTMGCFWSATDDTFIDSYSKTRDLTIFIVSATQGRSRVMFVMNKPFEIRIDNLGYEVIYENGHLETDLKKVIEEKVTKRTPVYNYSQRYPAGYGFDYDYNDDIHYNNYPKSHNYTLPNQNKNSQKAELKNKVNNAIRYNKENGVISVIGLDFKEAQDLAVETQEEKPKIERDGCDYVICYKTKDKQNAIEKIKEIKFYVEEVFESDFDLREGWDD